MASPGDVVEITVLKSQPDSDKALELLRKIASKVKPIMKAHGWIVPTLAEFFPKNPNLLGININRGKKICIRLRPASDPYSFLGLEEELIGTMLHELTHNHRGPHDEVFFKYLDSLWVEYDKLIEKGYQGEGFLGVGNRVGVGVSHDTPGLSMKEAREKSLKKLEEKERLRKLLGSGGALGGRPAETKGRRMGDVLADAAERRLKARKACGGDDDHSHPSGSTQHEFPLEVQKEIERAEQDSKSYVIDLTQDDDSEEEDENRFGEEEFVKGKGKGKIKEEEREREESSPDLIIVSSTSTRTKPSTTPSSSSSSSFKRRPLTPSPSNKEGWICSLCTFQNPPLHLSCTICLSERPTPPSTKMKKKVEPRKDDDGWLCHVCAREMEGCWWTCRDCGTMKLKS